jgi:hypothetical protein
MQRGREVSSREGREGETHEDEDSDGLRHCYARGRRKRKLTWVKLAKLREIHEIPEIPEIPELPDTTRTKRDTRDIRIRRRVVNVTPPFRTRRPLLS